MDDIQKYKEIIEDRQLQNYMMQLVITHTSDPEAFMDELKLQAGQGYIHEAEPDRDAIRNLQEIISPNMQK